MDMLIEYERYANGELLMCIRKTLFAGFAAPHSSLGERTDQKCWTAIKTIRMAFWKSIVAYRGPQAGQPADRSRQWGMSRMDPHGFGPCVRGCHRVQHRWTPHQRWPLPQFHSDLAPMQVVAPVVMVDHGMLARTSASHPCLLQIVPFLATLAYWDCASSCFA